MLIISLSDLCEKISSIDPEAVFQIKDKEKRITGYAVDSRLVKAGELFFALPGAKVDGHEYLKDVAALNASAAVVSKKYSGPDFGLSLIRVHDVLETFQKLARNHVKASNAKIIAITGSVGKTTTKDFLTTILKKKFKVVSSPGNSNSQVGLPLALLNHVKGDEDFIIQEMGMTHPGQIAKLITIAEPDFALLTSVEYAHACNFASIDDIARAKSEIFLSPKTKIGVVAADLPNFDEVRSTGKSKKVTFSSRNSKADYCLEVGKNDLSLHCPDGKISLPLLNVAGKHNIHNLLAAITMARQVGVEWACIKEAIPTLELPERRLQRIERKGILFINDCYNAIPVAVKAALSELPKPSAGGKRVFFMGEMLELGDLSEQMHKEVAALALEKVDSIICFGPSCQPVIEAWQKAGKPAALYTEFDLAYNELKKQMRAGDVVLLKGSRSKGLWRVFEYLEAGK